MCIWRTRRMLLGAGPAARELSQHRADRSPPRRQAGPKRIHPGYGFLSENAEFRASLRSRPGIDFGRPAAGVRSAPWARRRRQGADGKGRRAGGARLSRRGAGRRDASRARPNAIGYPVLIKAVAGGGGKGMRVVRTADELDRRPLPPSAKRPPRSATAGCCLKSSSSARAISRCKSSATAMAGWYRCSSANARCSAAIRR